MSIIKYVNKNTRFRMLKRGDDMVKTESVTIKVPAEMKNTLLIQMQKQTLSGMLFFFILIY